MFKWPAPQDWWVGEVEHVGGKAAGRTRKGKAKKSTDPGAGHFKVEYDYDVPDEATLWHELSSSDLKYGAHTCGMAGFYCLLQSGNDALLTAIRKRRSW
jgi:hypothetical protein